MIFWNISLLYIAIQNENIANVCKCEHPYLKLKYLYGKIF